jgi:Cdc6-like AAA superfamily ATPase
MSKSTPSEGFERRYEIGQLFTPSLPVSASDLFAGRKSQLERVLDTVIQPGRHAIVYGERGVGKTSLVNVLPTWLATVGKPVIAPLVTCDTSGDFAAIWRSIFEQVQIQHELPQMGFGRRAETEIGSFAEHVPAPATPDAVRAALAHLSAHAIVVPIIDEFDRLRRGDATRLFADTIKILSDRGVPATLVLVGVADSVDDLITEHESVLRSLVQIPLPRMSLDELKQIVTDRLPRVGITIAEAALEKICLLSRGLPHYTHLLGQHAAWQAVARGRRRITDEHLAAATRAAIADAQQTVLREYYQATASPRTESLFHEVLLACALAPCDEFGYFTAGGVRGPLSVIRGRDYEIPYFSRHLHAFASDARGGLLQQIGQRRSRRYRFRNPLLQPYAIIRGVAEGLISLEQAAEIVAG